MTFSHVRIGRNTTIHQLIPVKTHCSVAHRTDYLPTTLNRKLPQTPIVQRLQTPLLCEVANKIAPKTFRVRRCEK